MGNRAKNRPTKPTLFAQFPTKEPGPRLDCVRLVFFFMPESCRHYSRVTLLSATEGKILGTPFRKLQSMVKWRLSLNVIRFLN